MLHSLAAQWYYLILCNVADRAEAIRLALQRFYRGVLVNSQALCRVTLADPLEVLLCAAEPDNDYAKAPWAHQCFRP